MDAFRDHWRDKCEAVDAAGQTSGDETADSAGQENKNVPGQKTTQTPGQSPGLGGFRRPDRLALELRLRGLTYQQIAVVLNLSTSTAYKAVSRALARWGRRERKVLLKVVNMHRGLLRDGRVDLRTVVREFYQARTPRQLGQLHQLTLRYAREKIGRTQENNPRGAELNARAPNNLQLEIKLADRPRTCRQENER